MTTLKERVPKPLRTPAGIFSYVLGLAGIAVGYILTLLGIVLYYDLALEGKVGAGDSAIVFVTGLVVLVVGYLGLKGFMYFSY